MNTAGPVPSFPAPAPGHLLAVTVDSLVSGVHFPPGTSPADAAFKCLAVNLSDLAAMGAEPLAGQALCESPAADEAWCECVARAMEETARREFGFTVGIACGTGECRRLTLQAMGQVPRGLALTRHGARAGDRVWISGTPGDAGAGLAVAQGRLDAGADAAWLLRRLERPEPRLGLGIALRGIASAAIDVSDGIAGDAGHVARRSRVELRIHRDWLPLSPALRRATGDARAKHLAAFAGDDYELLFTAPPDRDEAVADAARAADTLVQRVGEVVEGPPRARILDASGRDVEGAAFEHFGPAGPAA